ACSVLINAPNCSVETSCWLVFHDRIRSCPADEDVLGTVVDGAGLPAVKTIPRPALTTRTTSPAAVASRRRPLIAAMTTAMETRATAKNASCGNAAATNTNGAADAVRVAKNTAAVAPAAATTITHTKTRRTSPPSSSTASQTPRVKQKRHVPADRWDIGRYSNISAKAAWGSPSNW
ncbi:hypothetical protein SOM11_06630, partial [Frigoribacterium sp. CFBP9039]|uniref:hypothetical protein n=1 Tax=Frigoribacterium sp. CFBP9029 TaxID=3096541 RepID=UPI002A6A08A5